MNIVFVSYHYWPPHFGGELLLSIERFESLVQRGYKVIVLTSGVPSSSKSETKNGIEIFRCPLIHDSKFGRGLRRLYFPIWVLSKMKEFDFDILHLSSGGGVELVTGSIANWVISSAAKKKGAKIVYVHSLADTETEMFSERGFSGTLRNSYLSKTDAIISVSPALHHDVNKYYPAQSRCIPNCVRNDIFVPLSEEEREIERTNNSLAQDQVVFTFLGSLSNRKGIDLLINAFLNLYPKYPNWKLWLIGPYNHSDNQNLQIDGFGNLLNEVRQRPYEIRLWGRINDRKELSNLLSISDVFVFPTRKEGLPLAPLEAMSTGIPVIISRIPGVTDLANVEGETGLYSQVGDLASLEIAMETLGNNKEMRRKMGASASRLINENFSWKKFIDQWEHLYLSLMNN